MVRIDLLAVLSGACCAYHDERQGLARGEGVAPVAVSNGMERGVKCAGAATERVPLTKPLLPLVHACCRSTLHFLNAAELVSTKTGDRGCEHSVAGLRCATL